MTANRPTALIQCAVGIAALCLMDAIVKHLAATTPIPIITLGRYVSGTFFALIVWQVNGRPAITRAMLPAHLLRGTLIAGMAFAFYWSLKTLPLAEAITLSFIAPLLVPPLASLFLGERMQPRFLAAGLLGFVGVIVTVQGAPRFDGDRQLALAAVLFAAVAYALASVVLRARAASDGATVVTLLSASIPMLILSPIAIGAAPIDTVTLAWLVAMGIVGNIGVQLFARAYAEVEAQVLAVLEFIALPFGALFGWLFFAEAVRPQVWAGAAIILAACLWAGRSAGPATKPQPQA